MGKLTEGNFKLKQFKHLKSGITAQWKESIVLSKDVVTTAEASKKLKDDPHVDLVKALQAIQEVVRYDEGYGDDVDIKITGVNVFPEAEVAIITHIKEIESGATARNSGRISKGGEEFEKAERLFELIKLLEHQVYEYIFNNKRAQLSMAFDDAA